MKIGDRVRISKNSKYYNKDAHKDSTNPTCEGVLAPQVQGIWPYRVKWDNGETNSYEEGDLELVLPVSFEIGDRVRAFGVDGVVEFVESIDHADSVRVKLGDFSMHFYKDGRYLSWHKEPSLTLIEKAPKTALVKFYLWINEHGSTSKCLLSEEGKKISGKQTKLDMSTLKKIPGTEMEIEVDAKLFDKVGV